MGGQASLLNALIWVFRSQKVKMRSAHFIVQINGDLNFGMYIYPIWGLRLVGTGSRKRNVAQKGYRQGKMRFINRKTSSGTKKRGGRIRIILSMRMEWEPIGDSISKMVSSSLTFVMYFLPLIQPL